MQHTMQQKSASKPLLACTPARVCGADQMTRYGDVSIQNNSNIAAAPSQSPCTNKCR